jgi:hypothetical protein
MLQSKSKTNANILDAELLKNETSKPLPDNDLSVYKLKEPSRLNASVTVSSAYTGQSDREAPMPPVALAPLMHSNVE